MHNAYVYMSTHTQTHVHIHDRIVLSVALVANDPKPGNLRQQKYFCFMLLELKMPYKFACILFYGSVFSVEARSSPVILACVRLA